MIDRATIDRIFEAAKIEEVVSDYVSLKRRGVNYMGLCPFHNEKTPSFTVSPAKGICKCFGCGKGGNPVNFLMELEQLSYVEALRMLAKKYHIEIQEKEESPEQMQERNDRESMLIVNEFAGKYFHTQLTQSKEGRAIGLGYFLERGFQESILEKFNLGFSPEKRDAFTLEALNNGYKAEYLVKTGLTIQGENYQADRFRGRVMFPIHNISGKIIGFGGRILKTDAKTAKYLNSPESEIYHKGNILYGIFHAKRDIVQQDRCFLVEGYTDVLSMHQAGIENVVASSGTALTPNQIRLIKRFTNNITVIYDGDAAGIKASLRGTDLILEQGMNIRILLLPDGEDPDSFAKKQSASSFKAYIEANNDDFIKFKTRLLLSEAQNDPIKKAGLVADIVRSIAIIPDQIIRQVYAKECATLMEIDEKVIHDEITKLKQNQSENNAREERRVSMFQNAATDTHSGYANPSGNQARFVKSPLDIEERTLIKYLIKYGETPLFNETDAEHETHPDFKVAEYILGGLAQDNIKLENPIYQFVLDEYIKERNDDFQPQTFFVQHPNPQMSGLATDIIAEPYEISKIHTQDKRFETEDQLLKMFVPKALMELKSKILQKKIKDLYEQLKKVANQEEEMQVLTQINQCIQINKQLGKVLGGRIVSPR